MCPHQGGSDLFQYELTFQGRTVRAVDTAVPDALQPAIELLNQVVEGAPVP